jgi:acyl-homoserine lactone synthase
MAIIMVGRRNPFEHRLMRAMFEARKSVFVDLLKWDVPVVDGRFEMDRFDDDLAVYVIVTDPEGRHLGSARLLQTMRPHILDTLFPNLCADRPPRGAGILEITRFCLDRDRHATERRIARNRLVSAMVDYAIDNGIHAFTGVAETSWLQQVLAFGWKCKPLGLPRSVNGRMLGAIRIEIEENTPALLSWNDIYAPDMLQKCALEAA